jgi:hypothetical protein
MVLMPDSLISETAYAKTISKELAREALRQIVLREMEELVAAQIAQAKGLKYLVTRDRKTGKLVRVTKAMASARSLGPNEEIIEVWEKDPSVQAFTDLMNRALDKPKEQEQSLNIRSELDIVTVLRRRQDRLREGSADSASAGARHIK